MSKTDCSGRQRNIVREWRLRERDCCQRHLYPPLGILGRGKAASFAQEERLPNADGRQPQPVGRTPQFPRHPSRQPLIPKDAPQPNMSIEKKVHGFRASHSSSSAAGAIISPVILAVPFSDPIQSRGAAGAGGGTISATGLPKRVTRTGLRVIRTCSITARQVALNFEMAISSMRKKIPWSKTMVKQLRRLTARRRTLPPGTDAVDRSLRRAHNQGMVAKLMF